MKTDLDLRNEVAEYSSYEAPSMLRRPPHDPLGKQICTPPVIEGQDILRTKLEQSIRNLHHIPTGMKPVFGTSITSTYVLTTAHTPYSPFSTNVASEFPGLKQQGNQQINRTNSSPKLANAKMTDVSLLVPQFQNPGEINGS